MPHLNECAITLAAVLWDCSVTVEQPNRWLRSSHPLALPSLFPSSTCSLRRQHWPLTHSKAHTHTHSRTYLGCPLSPLTNKLRFGLSNTATSVPPSWVLRFLTRVVSCVSSSPSPSFDVLTIWWISARLRQGVRHGRIRYKLSLLQGTASHQWSPSAYLTPLLFVLLPSYLPYCQCFFLAFFALTLKFLPCQGESKIGCCSNVFENIVSKLKMLSVLSDTEYMLCDDANRCLSFPHAAPTSGTLCRE